MEQTLVFPDNDGSSAQTNSSNQIAVILDDTKNTADPYEQQIADLQESIAQVQQILINYTNPRSEHQSVYQEKQQTIRELEAEYKRLVWDHMSEKEQQDFEEQKKREADIWQDIFSRMGFDHDSMRGEFATQEEFFDYHQQERKKQADANYVKKSMEEVTGELVDQIKDVPLKIIYRKISFLLHADRLSQNPNVAPYPDYLEYLYGVYVKIIDAREKYDKAAMISLIQDAGIRYVHNTFVLASYTDFKDIAIHENKKTLIHELKERLDALKTSYIYLFYLKHTQGEIQKELRDLDDTIQELEDLIASYQATDEQSSTSK